jgi:hypothetical protein
MHDRRLYNVVIRGSHDRWGSWLVVLFLSTAINLLSKRARTYCLFHSWAMIHIQSVVQRTVGCLGSRSPEARLGRKKGVALLVEV